MACFKHHWINTNLNWLPAFSLLSCFPSTRGKCKVVLPIKIFKLAARFRRCTIYYKSDITNYDKCCSWFLFLFLLFCSFAFLQWLVIFSPAGRAVRSATYMVCLTLLRAQLQLGEMFSTEIIHPQPASPLEN